MNLLLIRDTFSPSFTLGKLFIDGKFECETLEDCDRKLEQGGEKLPGRTAIPRGTYPITVDFSNHFARYLPHVLNVPQFEGIRIHCGNTDKDTEGCVLVGQLRINGNSIGYSRAAFDILFPKFTHALEAGDTITLEVR